MSDSLSTHLDQSPWWRDLKSRREAERSIEFYRRNICAQSGVLGGTDKGKRGDREQRRCTGGRRETGRSEVGGGERGGVGSRVEFAANEHLRLLNPRPRSDTESSSFPLRPGQRTLRVPAFRFPLPSHRLPFSSSFHLPLSQHMPCPC
jgi:hypothetical protein